ncbi:MAG: winged helix-turn-helix transcriptional regulator [Candidatus Thermoplasmatota archaeon]
MRLRLVLPIAMVLLVTAPCAVALPDLLPNAPTTPPVQPGPEPQGTLGQLKDTAATAAGITPPATPISPITVPVDGVGWGEGILIGVITLTGLAAVGLGAFFYGGARFVTPSEVLQNHVRQDIYAYLKNAVGANLKQLTDDLHLTTTNAIWHLRKLEEAGLIHSRRFNGYKVFYPADGGIEARRLSLGKTALQNANAQEVFEHVVDHPGTHQREIARALGVNHGTVRWHLKKLMGAELITETRRGKASSYEPTSVGLAALREVGPRAVAAPALDLGTSTAA